ncbi:hypothetical protein [Cytobacillus horneckiae]|uniref:hypothetical protein n=1 Tax=Cytobacillus horneckiae TaxID=549687 RepID=UPI003D9A6BBA
MNSGVKPGGYHLDLPRGGHHQDPPQGGHHIDPGGGRKLDPGPRPDPGGGGY